MHTGDGGACLAFFCHWDGERAALFHRHDEHMSSQEQPAAATAPAAAHSTHDALWLWQAETAEDDDEAVFAAKERKRHAKDTARLAPTLLGGGWVGRAHACPPSRAL